jgi:hypothetical protein
MNRLTLRFLVTFLILVGSVGRGSAQNKIPIGGVVYNYVGRVYINPETGDGEVAGYFVEIAGIQSPFQGAPSEATAYFTFRSDPLHSTVLPPNGDLTVTVLNYGKWHIYYNPNPVGDWNHPSSFSRGQLIADLDHNALEEVSVGPVTTSIFSGALLASYDFVYGGTKYNFADFFPDGITNFGTATNTPQTGTAGLPIALPFAGSAIAKGPTHARSSAQSEGKFSQ